MLLIMWRQFVLGGMMIVLAACAAGAASAAAPEGPRLAVIKWDLFEGRYELETIDRTGALPLRLAGGGERKRPLPEIFEAPTWSPDGSKIAFVGVARSLESGLRGDRLYVVGADGRGLKPLFGTHGSDSPAFAPDGNSIAFTRARRRGASIWLASLEGGVPKRITPARRGLYMLPGSFSPDGSTLLATRFTRRRKEEIVAVHLSTGEVETVLRGAGEPVYSPDGARFALLRWRPLRRRDGTRTVSSDLFTARADGSGLRRLTHTRYQEEAYPSWDPSGERLAFVRYLPETVESEFVEAGLGASVMQMNADGTCPRQILEPSIVAIYGAAWQPGPGREAGRIKC
jgi:dipeptidyl aminopeptidase/acylaminoacyl peptidase